MSNNYALRALIDEIGNTVYEGRWKEFGRNVPVPLIPCQYNGMMAPKDPHSGRRPAGNQYPDKSWEGARRVNSNGSVGLEYYSGFVVLKDTQGRCLIPATPNNIKRLDSMKSGVTQRLVTKKEVIDGVVRTKRVRQDVKTPPLYTRLEQDAASTDIDALVKSAVARALEAHGIKATPEDTLGEVEVPVTQAPVPAPKGVVDVDANGHEKERQPAAPAAGGDDNAPPPAKSPQPAAPTGASRRSSVLPALAEAAARAAAAED